MGSWRRTLYCPFIERLERVRDLAQSLQFHMCLSRDFTSLPIRFDIFELLRR